MARLVSENEAALQRAVAQDFKTASQEYIFETLACLAPTILYPVSWDNPVMGAEFFGPSCRS